VICETVYINQNDGSGWERLVPLRDEAVQSTARNITTSELVPVSRDGDRDLEEPPQVSFITYQSSTSVDHYPPGGDNCSVIGDPAQSGNRSCTTYFVYLLLRANVFPANSWSPSSCNRSSGRFEAIG